MNWIDINIKQPEWYTNVELMVNGKVEQHWHRLTDGENIYYGSLKTDSIIFEEEVSHWKILKYE